jgi:hypothetical protein
MIWTKTATGRAEIGARALVHERARRNLLLLIDGVRPQAALLGSVAGISPDDFEQLARLGLIARAPAGSTPPPRPAVTVAPVPRPTSLPDRDPGTGEHLPTQNYGQLTTKLTQLISSELGLRGFLLTLAVEKAADIKDLASVTERVLAEIAKRKGDRVAETARRSLFGA